MDKIFKNCSQPFLYSDNNIMHLLCCYAQSHSIDTFDHLSYPIRFWKAHIITDIKKNNKLEKLLLPERISGYGKVVLECNPCVYADNTMLTYTCGIKEDDQSPIRYYLVGIENFNIQENNNIKVLSNTFNGVIHDSKIYQISRCLQNIEIVDIKNTKNILYSKNILNDHKYGGINRITKIFNTNHFIVTFSKEKGEVCSIILDDKLNLINTLDHTYKCSIYKQYLAYTVMHKDGIESRSIHIKNYQ